MTFGELQAALSDVFRSFGADFPASLRGLCINAALQKIQRQECFRWCRHSEDLVLEDGERTVDLPDDFIDARLLRYLDGTTYVNVEIMREEDFDLKYPFDSSASAANPIKAKIEGSELVFNSAPALDLTLELKYWRMLASLVESSDSNAFTVQAWRLVLYTALAEAATFGQQFALPGLAGYQAQAEDALLGLIVDEARLGSDARSRPVSKAYGEDRR